MTGNSEDHWIDRERIEVAYGDYEAQWQRGEGCCAARIRAFLESQKWNVESIQAAFLGLAEIDVERDWMCWRKWLQHLSLDTDPSYVLSEFNQNSTIEDYLHLSAELGIELAPLSKLAEIEFRARHAWGDAPAALRYVDFGCNWRPSTPAKSMVVHFSGPTGQRTFPLHSLTEFGRQRSSEHELQTLIVGSAMSRYVLVARSDDRFSRRQFSVQVLSPEVAAVTNLSQKNPLHFADGQMLSTECTILQKFPFCIEIVDVAIDFI